MTNKQALKQWNDATENLAKEFVRIYYPEYNIEYKSMDDAIQYIRAKENINITSVRTENENVDIYCAGDNDMATKCYLFTESGNQITFQLINLPQINLGSGTVVVTVDE